MSIKLDTKRLLSSFFSNIGEIFLEVIETTGFTIILLFETIFYLKNIINKRSLIIKEMYIAAIKSFVVCSIVALFTGMVLALQAGIELMAFQQQAMVGNLVIATMTREMGPFMTAIVLIASVGSAMAAEIGTMKVSEEIDALEMMSISPVNFLVMPRVVALSIVLPMATVYVNFLGTLGGGLVAKFQLNVSFDIYYMHVLESLFFKATYVGLFKAFIFGIIISGVSCAQGLKAENGALGVGKATRSSVVISFVMVLIIGYFITSIFYG
ncbi:MAG: ABC transporter permease [Spirochaetota bacterium]|nr:ABC transporter permease [Spirochaetota bacterium]